MTRHHDRGLFKTIEQTPVVRYIFLTDAASGALPRRFELAVGFDAVVRIAQMQADEHGTAYRVRCGAEAVWVRPAA